MVEAVLLDATQLDQLRQHVLGEVQLGHERQPLERAIAGEDLLELAEHALRGDLVDPRRSLRGRGDRSRLRLESQPGDEARQPQHTQRVAVEGLLRHHPKAAPLEVGRALVRIDQRAALQRLRDRVHREVALGEVLLDGLALQGGHVNLPAATRRVHPPGTEVAAQLEHGTTRDHGEMPRERPRVTGYRDVQIEHGAAQKPVAHRAADDPRRLVPQRLSRHLQRLAQEALTTRDVSAHVTS